jgi:uncharacterized protein with GYD domain
MAEGMGGQLESFYFGFGDHDAFVVIDLPDHEAAAADALAVNASGGATVKTTGAVDARSGPSTIAHRAADPPALARVLGLAGGATP